MKTEKIKAKVKRREPSSFLVHMTLKPVGGVSSNLEAVLFELQEVAVAVDADFAQWHERVLHARLTTSGLRVLIRTPPMQCTSPEAKQAIR